MDGQMNQYDFKDVAELNVIRIKCVFSELPQLWFPYAFLIFLALVPSFHLNSPPCLF